MRRNFDISRNHRGRHSADARRWQRAVDASVRRGELACEVLSNAIDLSSARVLDAGCGVGGASIALRGRGAIVTGIDRNIERLRAMRESETSAPAAAADLRRIPFPDATFDAVVLQDVLEHTPDPTAVLREASRALAPGGAIYISTPGRWSIMNALADPHWGLPFVSWKRRQALRRTLRKRRPADAERDDLAELLSLRDLENALRQAGLRYEFMHRTVANRLFDDPGAVVWSDFHLRFLKALSAFGMKRPFVSIAGREFAIVNRAIVPTWHLLCRKEA
jgi:SAM-dependent methyltransferase